MKMKFKCTTVYNDKKYKSGDVLDVSEKTAERWKRNKIAVPVNIPPVDPPEEGITAGETAKTKGEAPCLTSEETVTSRSKSPINTPKKKSTPPTGTG